MELPRSLVSEAPALRTFRDDKPTLLVCWWCTFYAVTVILFRVCGRYVRAEKIFTEDGIMLLAIVPLFLRMALIHVVLLFGTNNAVITNLSVEDVRRREIGSQLVLVSRIMYTTYLWTVKYSTLMFIRSLAESFWQSSHKSFMRFLHALLIVTFLAVVISDLAACQPFANYWQVIPDPGLHCRGGYVFLITMGTLNVMTNFALFLFALPALVLMRGRKTSIIFRLALPLLSTALTMYSIPYIIHSLGAQPIRSLIASFDILLATFMANATVLTSLLQDRGYKKSKFKQRDMERDRRSSHMTAKSRTIVIGGNKNRWGSDEDLIRNGELKDMIGMEVLNGEKPPREMGGLERPDKARLQEIRVDSAWEVHVDERGSVKDHFPDV
ncbi:hypothetical protein LAWI1_G004578 [Lachnellula willkommii]|uniref:Rhodopsin domain-containing protein n=1 Tax=Lachnellula willkommii TaxID=215461 RepID=A0A559M6E5_9HELO|nr:hypothetical protein LAWI1_G004578 [Lachnellula willkommii]